MRGRSIVLYNTFPLNQVLLRTITGIFGLSMSISEVAMGKIQLMD